MQAEVFLEAVRQMPLAAPIDLTGGHPFVVLSPHPDDESLGTGGLIAAACCGGERVDVVILTDGSGSHPQSLRYPRERLVSLRQTEAERAVAHLGLPPDRVVHLGLPDTQAPMVGPLYDAAFERIHERIAATGARSVFVTWGRDPHCDHEAADAMARALRRRDPGLKLWSYPIWGWHLDPAGDIEEPLPQGFRIDIAPWLDAKHAAIGAHVSQMTDLIDDDPAGFRFTETTLAPFMGPFEYFFAVPA